MACFILALQIREVGNPDSKEDGRISLIEWNLEEEPTVGMEFDGKEEGRFEVLGVMDNHDNRFVSALVDITDGNIFEFFERLFVPVRIKR
jgi:hypothetical protein